MNVYKTIRHGVAVFAVLALAACGGGAELGDGGGSSLGGSTTGGGTTGGDTGGAAAAVALHIIASSTQLDSSAATSGGVALTAQAVDADNVIIDSPTVVWSANSGALTTSGATATLTTGGDSTSRTITVQAAVDGVSDSIAIMVVPTPAAPSYRMGKLNGGTFTAGAIDISQASLGAGGSTGLSVSVVDVNNGNQLVNQAIDVSFNSSCISSNLSEIQSTLPSLGTVNATYRAKGCSGGDTITASATAPNGAALTASGNVTVAASPTGAVEFVLAERSVIGIAGTGSLPETAQLTFKVVNTSGGPVPDAAVSFALETGSAAGVTLSPATGTTGTDGTVSVTVNAGGQPGTVRVRATAAGKSTVSSALLVSTGLPVQQSYSLSAECFNVAGLDHDGVEVPVTIRMADRYSNWPPEGTAAYFSATGGSVGAATDNFACLTGGLDSASTAGTCTATWRSQNPRPNNGRVTVTATSQGEDGTGSPIGNITNLTASLTLIMSGDTPQFSAGDFLLDGAAVSGTLNLKTKSISVLSVVVRDRNDQPMPNGTTISLSVADAGTVSGTSSWKVPCTTADDAGSNTYSFRIKGGDINPPDTSLEGSADLTITVPTPGGTLTTVVSFVVKTSP